MGETFRSQEALEINPNKTTINKSEKKEGLTKEEEPRYGEILYDKSLVFHGVGFDLTRLRSILEKGILSEQAAQAKGLELTRNFGGYNLSDSVSVAESPAINNSFTFGCFNNYIKGGISFVIADEHAFKAPKGSSQDSGYLDEAFIKHEVERKNITGVMVPADLLDAPLADLPLNLAEMGYNYTDKRCKKIISDLETETGYRSDTTELEKLIEKKEELENQEIDYFEKDKQRKDIFAQMEKSMSQYVEQAFSQKLGIDHPTLKDVLKLYLPKSMKIYNSDGFDISL
ncbi:MAG: hypothetical protein PHE59_00235 [Patescibacteria group bacterium]|nr:hypothetical protein [Patescibacteria group bacterium]MDD5164599.1 hypothetical protein [Patescibacteria group bacterium]MDD5534354.1 hypothetical protein [Patescibacteria group bacterium]